MVEACSEDIKKAAELIIDSYKQSGKLLLCGNGGSASQSQHIAAEMINKFRFDRQPLAAIALTTDTSNLTSIGNDSGFQYVFVKQIKALGKKEDVLVIITTSDVSFSPDNTHSLDLGLALKAAKELGIKTIGMVSEKTKEALPYLDVAVRIPSRDTPRTQEGHITALHIICDLVEQEMFPK
ncbi:hypothetical protein A2160_02970 [Candidatus Beckwithbacteria bacterium RBG_13_42_9]|uniref:SIS domain-containing protein n=1 Tax=Candidatus Beckwithbacteria bacterium RBG_13_42_9 TaxID=1797457 RepID=A0A1F5E872_9BACT|nr:MAG: hypothetical protein A2160_02970 [Candidatus Beckwithbacteria bacterium RBG_13_42_9]